MLNLRPHLRAFGAALLAACALAPAASADDAAKKEPTVLRLGTLAPEGTPWADLLVRFQEKVAEASKGTVKVKLSLNGRSGDEPEMLEKMGGKKLDGGGFTTSGLATLVPELSLLELPFLFASDAEADLVMDTVVREDYARLLEAKGLKLFAWAVNGWSDFGAVSRPVKGPGDLKASKPWTRGSPARSALYQACGAEPQALPVPEVLAALQGGKVDLVDTTPLFAASARWHTATKHWTHSRHAYQPAALVLSLAAWNALPADVQAALTAYAPTLQAEARKAVRGLDAQLLDQLRKEGVAVHELTPAERGSFVMSVALVPAKLVQAGAFPQALHGRVVDALTKARAEAAKAADPLAPLLEKTDALTAKRPDMPSLHEAEKTIEEARRIAPQSFEVAWRLARSSYFRGRYGSADEKIARFEAGIERAKRAISLDERRVEGHFWLAVLYGVFGEAKGITSSLFLVGDMEKELEKARDLDAKFDGAGPLRVLGRLLFKLPWAAGGSNKKSMENLRKALSLAPEMPFNAMYLAEVLIDEGEDDEARKLLQGILSAAPTPRWAPEHAEAVVEAKKMLQKLD